MPYELLCVSVIGSSHVKAGTDKEDYGAVYDGGFYRIFAVADGHGDSNCPRSSFGSRLACELAISELSSFAETLHETEAEEVIDGRTAWEAKLFDDERRDGVIHQLINSVFGKWSDAVLTDLENKPLSESERAGCGKYIERYDKGLRLEHIYGTTLIAGLITDTYLLLLQQGDGRCDVFSYDGEVSQPIPWDEKCFANVCTSLCDEDAIERCRYYIEDVQEYPVSAVLAASDGIEDSFFDMEQLHSYFREQLIFAADNSVPMLQAQLSNTLPEFSVHGSNDDVTICGFIDIEQIRKLTGKFIDENYRCEIYGKIAQMDEHLKSVQGKYEYDLSRYEQARAEFERTKSVLDTLNEDYADYARDLPTVTAAFCDAQREESKSFFARLLGRELSDKTIDMWPQSLEAKILAMNDRIDAARKALEDAEATLKPLEEEYLKTKERKEGYLAAKREYLGKIEAYESGKADAAFCPPADCSDDDLSESQCGIEQTEGDVIEDSLHEGDSCSTTDSNIE